MGQPGFNTVHRHPRFALSLVLVLLITTLLLIAPRPGATPFDGAHYLWRPSGPDIYVDKTYNPGVAMWGDLHQILQYSEGIYQQTIRDRNNLDCVIYSSGVAQESSFEKQILERSSSCKIYGYDFSVENWGPQIRDVPEFKERIAFKPWKLQPVDNPSANPPEYSLQGLMKKNGHTFIDILKLDIEGSEFDVLDSIFKEYKGKPLPFGQLQLEVHVGSKSFADFLHWWERLEEAGLRPFWTEVRVISRSEQKNRRTDRFCL
ncbi:hypothetical protein FRC18_003625 [Serendipita sp. 400]|nr:hypothetical protein FRC18_003625 [Serendipita sp. 400]